ncbi:hypothetical protein AQUCO_00400003v1 [Aquilegia coerulea]|uniref:Uncharacterized protein n=1 Tax=Aquilegia coerulea TaxID=218851 RepID=A0A2G5ET37_AQUCA|nr:hypothetical protein AQUCO_00400003v1 [Aquilegia coerulea]
MSKISVVILWIAIGLIFELMMMVLTTIGLVKFINHPKEDNSGEEVQWILFVLVGASLGCIVFVTQTIVVCCWWKMKKTKQSKEEGLPIAIPSNSANI